RPGRQGLVGLASGKDPNCFDRVWFKEQVEQADITFDYDTYLLTAAKAKALKQGQSQPATPAAAPAVPTTPTQQSTTTITPAPTPTIPLPTPTAPKATQVVWHGELKREQWNPFS